MFKRVFTLFLLLVSAMAHAQTTRTVTNTNDSGPGSMRQLIYNANPNDTITFAGSLLANGSTSITLQSVIIVNKPLVIKGINTATDTLFVDGNNATQLFYIDITNTGVQRTMVFENMALVNGLVNSTMSSNPKGGAIAAWEVDLLVLNSCFLKGNKASGRGGAVYGEELDIIVTDCSVINNEATYGGGIWTYSQNPKVFNCITSIFFNNTATTNSGAALWTDCMYSSLIGCEFAHNSGQTLGGAVAILGDSEIRDCVFFRNSCAMRGAALCLNTTGMSVIQNCLFKENIITGTENSQGGAVNAVNVMMQGCTFQDNVVIKSVSSKDANASALDCSSCQISNSTFSGNQNSGGATAILRYACDLDNVTFTGNTSSDGLFYLQYNSGGLFDTITFRNCIISQPQQKTLFYQNVFPVSLGNNFIQTNEPWLISSDVVAPDPQLGPLQVNGTGLPTHMPLPGSPVINKGTINDFAPAQNGPIFRRREIGAAEFQLVRYDSAAACGQAVTWWDSTFTTSGTYIDTAYNANSIDSVGVLVLYVQDTSVSNLNGTLQANEQHQGTTYQWIDCATNTAITGATDTNYLPTANGSYAVVVSRDGCSDTSSCVQYVEFGLNESITTQPWITFYPNPTHGHLQFTLSGAALQSVEVLDLSGRSITVLHPKEDHFTLPNLLNGMYLLKWTGEDGRVQVDRVEMF